MQNVYLFITIIKKSDAKEFLDFYLERDAAPIYSSICEGSATSETLSLLGLEHSEKVLMQSLVPQSMLATLKYDLTHKMSIDLPDRGIALAVPLASIVSKRVLGHITGGEGKQTAAQPTQTNERKIFLKFSISEFDFSNPKR